jgi:lipopolysaccharide biosynthesis protein
MSKAELLAQIEAMTEEEAEEVKLIYAPDWPDRVMPIEEVRKQRGIRPEALRRFDDGTPQPDWVALLHEAREGRR